MSEYSPQHTDSLAQESYRASEPENMRAHKIANGVLIAVMSVIALSLLIIGFVSYETYRIEADKKAFEQMKSTVLWNEQIVTVRQGENNTITEISFSPAETSDLDAVANHLSEVGPAFGSETMTRLDISWPQGEVIVLSPEESRFVSAADWRLILQYAQDSRIEKLYLSGNSLIFDLKSDSDSVKSFSNDFANLPLPVNVNKAIMQAEYSSPQSKTEYNINVYPQHAVESYEIAEELEEWGSSQPEPLTVAISSEGSPSVYDNSLRTRLAETDYRVAQIEINVKGNLVDAAEGHIDTATMDMLAQNLIQRLKEQGYTDISTVILTVGMYYYPYDYATESLVSNHG